MREVILNHEYLSAKEYANKTGAGYQSILDQCKNGTLQSFKTDGGQFRVKILKGDMVTKEQFEKLQEENIKLKSSLQAIKALLAM